MIICPSCVSPAQDLLVYLASDSAVHLTLEGLSCMNAQELGRNVREALNIPHSAVDVFAFWFCSPLLGNDCSFVLWSDVRLIQNL